jgi:hypothetical protein
METAMKHVRTVVTTILIGFLAGCQAVNNDPVLSSWDKKPPLSNSSGFQQPAEK